DPDVLGGHYTGHYANDLQPAISRAPGDKPHPILDGVETPFASRGSLYKTMPLAGSAVPLLLGTVPGCPAEPVAWVNSRNGLRVFFTSLGHPGDFASGAVRRLLRNAIFWALDRTPASGPAAGRAASDPKAQSGARPSSATETSSGNAATGSRSPF